MNSCDHGHMTTDEIRTLPIGGGGNILCCHRHYLKEAAFRREQGRRYDPKDWTIEPWEALTVYSEAELSPGMAKPLPPAEST